MITSTPDYAPDCTRSLEVQESPGGRLVDRAGMLAADLGIAVSWPVGAIAVHGTTELAVASARYVVALAPMIYILCSTTGFERSPIRVRWLILVMGGSMAAYNLFYLMGLSRAEPTSGALLVGGSMPIFAAVGAHTWLGEKVGPRRTIGIAVGAIGIAVILAGGGHVIGSIGGSLPFLAAGGAWALQTVTSKVVLRFVSSIEATAWSILFGAAVLIPGAAIGLGVSHFTNVSTRGLALGGMLGLTSTVLPLALSMWALRRLDAVEASMWFLLIPFVAALLSAVWLGSPMTVPDWVGGSMALVGVVLASSQVDGSISEL